MVEKLKNPNCSCDFSHGAIIKTESGRFLGATCDPREAESIIRKYLKSAPSPEPVCVFFGRGLGEDGTWGYTFRLVTKYFPSGGDKCRRKERIEYVDKKSR